jgi:hypothetical protein
MKINNRIIYWGLIITFTTLYALVGFVSTLHAISFFQLANNVALAIILAIAFEVGQSSVLFSLLMTKNKDKFLAWIMMFLLTGLQISGNVFASFKYISLSGSNDWMFWQKTILMGVQAANTEAYQVIISYIQGALLPIVALGMTALVAENIKMMSEETNEQPKKVEEKEDTVKDPELISDKSKENDHLVDFDKELEDRLNKNANAEKNRGIEFSSENAVVKESVVLDRMPLKEEPELIEESNIISDTTINTLPPNYTPNFDEYPSQETIIEKEPIKEEKIVDVEPPKKIKQPPKSKKNVAVSKKEQEPLLKEEVKVPKKRISDPLKKKSRIKRVKNLKEIDSIIHKEISKGDEALALIENIERDKEKESISNEVISEDTTHESLLVPPDEILIPYIQDGVEVIDAKAIPVDKNKKIAKVDKFGIPINPGEHRNFDRF